MKRLHVHVAVHDLQQSIGFYAALFAAEPTVTKDDYAKWMLDDPRVNFAISTWDQNKGITHLGIQGENAAELEEIGARLERAEIAVKPEQGVSCCYAKSDKVWTLDPQGIAWESFHTLGAESTHRKAPESKAAEARACCVAEAS
jgi:catechol 2,3-dioxygenase-like lactoylglutathione lyase family enzyme